MNKVINSILAASLCLAGVTTAAPVNWTTSPGLLDTEVSTNGVQIFGYYFAQFAGLPVVPVNTAPFALWQSAAAPAGLIYNGSYNNVEGADLYQVTPSAGNSGLNQILDGQSWGGASPLTVTGLIPGGVYQLQFMISDDRPNFNRNRNYDISDSNDPEGLRDIERAYHSTFGTGLPPNATPGSIEAKIFTGTFTADATGTQDIYNILYENENHTGGNSGSQVNAIQVRVIPEPATFALMGAALGALALRRRRA